MNEINLFIKNEKYQINIKEFLCQSKLNKNYEKLKYNSSLSFIFSEICNLKQIVENKKQLILLIFWNEKYFFIGNRFFVVLILFYSIISILSLHENYSNIINFGLTT
jgi:hypothetical protein